MSTFPYAPASVEHAGGSPYRRCLGLLGLIATLTVGAAVLYRLAGPPHLPAALPSWNATKTALMGSDVPYQALAYLLSTAAWVVWIWIVGSMLLRVLLALVESLARGAAWARSLRSMSDRVTLPVVRKLVDGTIVAATVVQLVGRTGPSAAAAPAPTTPVVSVVGTTAHTATLMTPAQPADEQRTATYRVQPGDNLWAIAERFYGDGSQFPRIIEANVDRPMGDGQWFPRNGVIQEGWVLLIPEPAQPKGETASPASRQQVVYDVRKGDTLRAVAARYYGDERRWPEIFSANRGVARLPDGHVLTNPNLIWPGLRLAIPGVAPITPASPPPAAVPARLPAQPKSHPSAKAPPVPAPAHVAAQATTTVPIAALTPAPAQSLPQATVRVAPTPAPAASQVATPALHLPTIAPTQAPAAHNAPEMPANVPPLLPAGLAALAVGGVVLLARRRFRTSLSEPPVPPDHEAGIPIRAGWADPAHARTFAKRLDGGTEPALLVAEQVLYCLMEAGIEDVTLIAVREGRHTMGLTLRAGLAAQERLLEIGPELAERLGATGVASRTPDHDILFQLSNLALLRLVVRSGDGPLSPVPLLALGILPRGEAFHVNWRALGNVLIASLPGGGANIVLTNLLTTLAARCNPDRLRLYTVAARDALPPPVLDLPHHCGRRVDPSVNEGVKGLLEGLRTELERRMDLGNGAVDNTSPPDIALVVDELADLPDDNDTVALLEAQGPAYGMHIVAATTRQETLNDVAIDGFDTRLVLRTLEEDQSIRLLGRPDAADLGGGGDLFVRVDGREPVRIHSFCVEPEYLNHLVDLMHAAYLYAPMGEAPAPMDVEPDQGAGGDADGDRNEAAEESLVDEQAATNGVVEPYAPTLNGTVVAETIPTVEPDAAAEGTTNGHIKLLSAESGSPPDQTAGVDLPPEAARARIQIRCFGELEVFGDGRPISAQGQYLPWELLIYLALQPIGGVPKQELLRLLWPNTDHDLAGRRLRAAMVRLRAVLGDQVAGLPADVVRGQRNGTCHLDPALVWSDAQQFLAVHQQARRLPSEQTTSILEQARTLYRGELFTQPYFGWMDRRVRGLTLRERFREQHATITFQLADCYEAEGRPACAAPLYAELLHAQPTLQDVARRLYRCCAHLGDGGTLHREHARLVAALEQIRSTAPPGNAQACALERETVAVYQEALAAIESVGVHYNAS